MPKSKQYLACATYLSFKSNAVDLMWGFGWDMYLDLNDLIIYCLVWGASWVADERKAVGGGDQVAFRCWGFERAGCRLLREKKSEGRRKGQKG